MRDTLKRVSFLQHLKMGELDTLVNAMERRAVHRGEVLIRQGDAGDAIYLIASGSLGVYKRRWLVLRQRIATRRRGDFVGELALLDHAPRNATLIADADGEVFLLTRRSFDGVLLASPHIAEMIRRIADSRHAQDSVEGFYARGRPPNRLSSAD